VKVCVACNNPIPEGKRAHAKYCSDVCGNRVRVMRFVQSPESHEREMEKQRQRRATVYGRYKLHKESAAQRGIPFVLTFEQWWGLWEPHWKGRAVGALCMCRTNDEGAYELGNVRIDTWANNIREARGLPLKSV
jgi:hypothetical protein